MPRCRHVAGLGYKTIMPYSSHHLMVEGLEPPRVSACKQESLTLPFTIKADCCTSVISPLRNRVLRHPIQQSVLMVDGGRNRTCVSLAIPTILTLAKTHSGKCRPLRSGL